jgi:putative restriction endonuclease
MSIYKKSELFDIIVQSIYDCGWNIIHISDSHPFKIRIFNENQSHQVKIYIWNLTHGGGPRSKDEYRIQIKVKDELEEEQGFKTLILGFWQDVGIFAGFDFQKHKGKPAWSASMQINKQNLINASLNGFSPYNNKMGEIVIAFRPDFFVDYITNLEQLHGFAQSNKDFQILEDVTDRHIELNNEVIEQISKQRKNIVLTVTKKLRDISFQRRVLNAYNYKCAFCDLQLKLVDASHILPVSHEDSTDETSNGITLCSLHHRAYDTAIVTFNEKYEIIANKTKMNKLKEIGHDSGMGKFIKDLRPIIHIPPAVSDRPHLIYIRQANKVRGWNF